MQQLVGDRFVWFNMQEDIAAWCCSCHSCQANQVHKHHRSPVHVIPVPEEPYSRMLQAILFCDFFTFCDGGMEWLIILTSLYICTLVCILNFDDINWIM